MSSVIPYSASTAYWFPWNEPFVYKYNLDEMAFDRVYDIYNISFIVLQSTLVYHESVIYSLGGVTDEYIPESQVLILSEEIGVKKCENMKRTRYQFPGVVLGEFLYVFGGLTQGGLTDACEKMNLETRTWMAISDMSEPKAAASACVLGQAVFIVGGSTPQLPFSSEIERYTPDPEAWSVLRIRLPCGLVNVKTFSMPTRPCFLIFGGYGETEDGRDVFLCNVQEGKISADLPKLKTALTDSTQFPVLYDHVSSVIHLLSGDGEKTPVTHSYYNIDALLRAIPETDDIGSPTSKPSQFITPSTKSEI